MGVHKTETQREKIGFSIGWEQKWIEWSYDIMLLLIVFSSVGLVLLIQEFFIPVTNLFLKDGVIIDYIKSYYNLQGTFYSSVYNLELFSEKYFNMFFYEFIRAIVFFVGEFAVLTILFYKLHRPWFAKLNKSLTKEIHVDRVLKGTDVRQDEDYLKKRIELGMNDSEEFVCLGKIYKREVIQ